MFFQHPVFKTFFSGSAVCVYVYRERMFLRLLRGAKTLLLSPPPKPDSEIEPFHLFPRVLPRRQKDSGLLKGAKKGVAPKRKVNCHRKKMRAPRKKAKKILNNNPFCAKFMCVKPLLYFLSFIMIFWEKERTSGHLNLRRGRESKEEKRRSVAVGLLVDLSSLVAVWGKKMGFSRPSIR